MTIHSSRSLEEQRLEFSRSRFLAMPIAGTIAWAIIGIISLFVPLGIAAWTLFICTGVVCQANHAVRARRTQRFNSEGQNS